MTTIPKPDEHGQYDAHELMAYINQRNIQRIEATMQAHGPGVYDAMTRMPWH